MRNKNAVSAYRSLRHQLAQDLALRIPETASSVVCVRAKLQEVWEDLSLQEQQELLEEYGDLAIHHPTPTISRWRWRNNRHGIVSV
jgi:hypothetical protein